MLTPEEIYQKVSAVLVEALNVEEDEVTPEARLQADLGAESIDFLDIVFRLEREFNIKIPRGELFPESIFQGDPEFVQQDRVVTEKGPLGAARPHALRRPVEVRGEPHARRHRRPVHGELITRYVQNKLEQQSDVGASTAK